MRGSAGSFNEAVAAGMSEFGDTVAPRLRLGIGSAEDALRDPLVRLLHRIGRALEMPVVVHGETPLRSLSVRLDYVVDVAGSQVGAVELKAPGKGVPNHWRPRRHDREQWQKLQLLPNVLYTDGTKWALYRWGEQVGPVGLVNGDLEQAGANLRAADEKLGSLLYDFLTWQPVPPDNLGQLIRSVARLCRLLRDEVLETLRREREGASDRLFTGHLEDWRSLLFPTLTDELFADGYAQTVTFGMLLARRSGVDFTGLSIAEIGMRLAKTHLLVGRALAILTEGPGRGLGIEERSIAVRTLRRVIAATDWSNWLESSDQLYEHFLELYDPILRRKSGSYFTPPDVANFVVNFVDELLERRLNRPRGLAHRDVVVVDPAMGSGTFVLSALNRVALNVIADGGDERAELLDFLSRMIGFERQIAPFAVAELKLHQLLASYNVEIADERVRFYVTDTLDDPTVESLSSPVHYEPIAESRRLANRVKADERVMVVFGNPPYLEQAKRQAGLILARNRGRSSLLDDFRGKGIGRLDIKLHNLNIYFWRWATWKVFEAHSDHPDGVVAFITTAAYTTGPGFVGMREYLRRQADWGWIIDLSPEGHQPNVPTRIFPKVQQPICIGIFGRNGHAHNDSPARVQYLAVSGTRAEKFRQLQEISLDTEGWRDCPTAWDAPFRPIASTAWDDLIALGDIVPWGSPGVKPNRTWVYAPEKTTLIERWRRLTSTDPDKRADLMKETRDRSASRNLPSKFDGTGPAHSLREERFAEPPLASIAFRSFDRQYIIADRRVVDFPRQNLWEITSKQQIFATTLFSDSVSHGPAVVFSSEVPDMHHFMGHHGGKVLPLYRDASGQQSNVAKGLLEVLSTELGIPVTAEDLFSYIGGIAAHGGYFVRFQAELLTPGLRVPLTLSLHDWTRAVELGRRVIWLHTYGERLVDGNERPFGPASSLRPAVVLPIPATSEGMPDEITYSEAERTLFVGAGALAPVSPEVWNYHVSSMHVVKHWFDYRRRHPKTLRSSELNSIVTDRWTAATTEALRNLLALLEGCVALEPAQRDLLDHICDGPLLTTTRLRHMGILPIDRYVNSPVRGLDGLF